MSYQIIIPDFKYGLPYEYIVHQIQQQTSQVLYFVNGIQLVYSVENIDKLYEYFKVDITKEITVEPALDEDNTYYELYLGNASLVLFSRELVRQFLKCCQVGGNL